MKIGAIIPVFKMTYFLPLLLKEIGWIDKIILLKNEEPWDGSGEDETHTELPDNVEVYMCDTKDQTEQRNYGLFLLRDYDLIFVLDSDEIILKADQIVLLACAIQESEVTAFAMEVKAYKDMSHIYDYDTGHTPIVLVRGGTMLRDIRCVYGAFATFCDGFLHHLKFLQPPESLEWRKNNKKHTREIKGVNEFMMPDELREMLEEYGCYYTNIERGELY
jgi:hypothetical protein